jgi:hypothetical protein
MSTFILSTLQFYQDDQSKEIDTDEERNMRGREEKFIQHSGRNT